MSHGNQPHELLPGVWRSVAAELERTADSFEPGQEHLAKPFRLSARLHRSFAKELEDALNEAARRAS